MKINVLGEEYTLSVCDSDKDIRLLEEGGLCDETTKEIVVNSYENREEHLTDKRNLSVQVKKTIRHEIIHAFLFESGLAENSNWAQNEEMVDFFAIQFPKILKALEQADAL